MDPLTRLIREHNNALRNLRYFRRHGNNFSNEARQVMNNLYINRYLALQKYLIPNAKNTNRRFVPRVHSSEFTAMNWENRVAATIAARVRERARRIRHNAATQLQRRRRGRSARTALRWGYGPGFTTPAGQNRTPREKALIAFVRRRHRR